MPTFRTLSLQKPAPNDHGKKPSPFGEGVKQCVPRLSSEPKLPPAGNGFGTLSERQCGQSECPRGSARVPLPPISGSLSWCWISEPTALLQLLDWGAANGANPKNHRQLKGLIKKNELLLVADEIQALLTKAQFQQAMQSAFRRPGAVPTPVHLTLTELPFVAALTSNYDTLLESAYTKKRGNQPPVFTSAKTQDLGWAMRGERSMS